MESPCTLDIVTPTGGWYIYNLSSFLVAIYTGGKDVYNVGDKQPGGRGRLDGKESQV